MNGDSLKETLARLFEMGEYIQNMLGLELATVEQNADGVVSIMEKLLESCRTLGYRSHSMSLSRRNGMSPLNRLLPPMPPVVRLAY